jgi:hypothetical protein
MVDVVASKIAVAPLDQSNAAGGSNKVGNFSGHACAVIATAQSAVVNGVALAGQGARTVVDATSRVCSEVEPLQQASKVAMLTMLTRSLWGAPLNRAAFDALETYDAFSDATGILRDGNYLFKGNIAADWKEKRQFKVLGRLSLIVADIAGTICWLAGVGAVNLSKLSTKIGNCRFFSLVKNVTLIGVARAFATAGFAFLALAAAKDIVNGEKITKNLLTLTGYVAEVAIKVLGFAGIAHPIPLIVLGFIAAGFSIAAYLYQSYADEAAKKIVKKVEVVKIEASVPIEANVPVVSKPDFLATVAA